MARSLTLDANTHTLFNETGLEGVADGLFYIEHGLYKATLLARVEVTVGRKKPRTERQLASATFAGVDAADLAKVMGEAGWEPPENLAALCEASAQRVRASRRGRRLFGEQHPPVEGRP